MTTVELDTTFTVDPRRYSSWNKLKRITAWINRFIDNCKKQKEERRYGELFTDEIKVAEIQLIKEVQRLDFKERVDGFISRKTHAIKKQADRIETCV